MSMDDKNQTRSHAVSPFAVFLVCYLAYTSIYIARLNLSMASPGFLETGLLTQAQVGITGSVFFVVYASGRILNGILGDRVSPWIMISAGLLLAGLANLLIGVNPSFPSILLLWGINAYAQSMLWSSLLRIVSAVYPGGRAKQMMSFMSTSVAIGNILGILLNTVIISSLGLRFAFLIPGGILAVLCLPVILTAGKVNCPAVQSRHIPMKQLVFDKKIRAVIAPAMFHGMIKDNISLWMTVFFVDQYGIDLNASAGFVLFIPVIGFLGRIAYPFLYRIYKEKEIRLSSHAFLMCIAAAAVLVVPGVPPLAALVCLSLIYAAISVINTYFLSAFPLQFSMGGNQSSVGGIMDFFTYLGAGIGSLVYGYLVDSLGYSAMFFSYVIVSVLSLVQMNRRLQTDTEC